MKLRHYPLSPLVAREKISESQTTHRYDRRQNPETVVVVNISLHCQQNSEDHTWVRYGVMKIMLEGCQSLSAIIVCGNDENHGVVGLTLLMEFPLTW